MNIVIVMMPLSLFFLLPAVAVQANPFDPSGYIKGSEKKKQRAELSLSTQDIYRINGARFLRFHAGAASVFLPHSGATVQVDTGLFVCPQHVSAIREVLLIRKGLKISPEARKRESDIVRLIQKCQQGIVKNPLPETPDGGSAKVKVKVKPKQDDVGPDARKGEVGDR